MPHILIVDDESDIRALLSAIIRSLGYTVTEADSGEAALEIIKEQPFDLALLDHHMGGMNGIDTAKELNQRQIPFVFCTSIIEDEVLRHALAQGALNYIVKPFSPPKVIFAIASSLGRIEEQEQNNLVQIATGILMEKNQMSRDAARNQLEADAKSADVSLDVAVSNLVATLPQ